ncbi:hypothetical protein FB567DRAFT_585047 [Paraphoma chrysanthemicola]|uniref:FAD-binding domain-containing protein n=1 Tax=Paraphoma chrysanthemicola TaxID=798071 RepID=A0A8K0QTQ0_9PLEO|nr:hypothetical protein FB567DRAFT_585047 [Paraphoma chrysanthemicola]
MSTNHGTSNSRGRILVVGAGYAGLSTAIELTRKGFEVEVIEAAKKLTTQGSPSYPRDMIQVGSNASRVMANWGKVLEQATNDSARPSFMTIFDKSGKELLKGPLPEGFGGFPVLYCNRGLLQASIFDYANSLGVKFRFGARVESFFDEARCAGVIIDGERVEADGVVAADGVHSAARKHVIGIQQRPRTSGFAVYRTCFPLELLANDPLTKPLLETKEDVFRVWLGTDVHAILFVLAAVKQVVIFCTHKDTFEVEESWTNPGDLDDMLKVVDGWDPLIVAAMKAVPRDKLIDWKLIWRDPIRQWVSTSGRITLAGDAAHPHLPTSGQGAAQAFEDAATLGAVIDKLGKEDIPTAFRVFEKLRFERTSLTQRMGWETRHRWHQTDWEAVAQNPQYLKMPHPIWLYNFDAEKYAYDRLDDAVDSISKGTAFVSSNTPEGHVHEDWTVDMMMKLEKEQAKEHFYRVVNS